MPLFPSELNAMPDIEQQPESIGAVTERETDVRRYRRYLCVDGGILRLSVRPEFRGRRAVLVDVSAGGIGFLVEEPLEAGTMLVFELKGSAGAEPSNRIAHVRHSRPHAVPAAAPWAPPASSFSRLLRGLFGKQVRPAPQAWLVGCQFDRPLSDAEIAEFLDQLQLDGTGPA
jgi:PilZ domain